VTLWLECRAVHVVLFSSSRLRRGKRDGALAGQSEGRKVNCLVRIPFGSPIYSDNGTFRSQQHI
jgi:hypothetical protein